MYGLDLQQRLVRNYADAAAGYTSAMMAAYGNAAGMMMQMWGETLKAASGGAEPQPRSWYREPPREAPGALPFFNPFAAFMPPAAAAFQPPMAMPGWSLAPGWPVPQTPANPFALAMAPAAAAAMLMPWMTMMASQRPAAGPMAYMMLAIGVPRSVAEPVAEANAAMLEAGQAVVEQVDQSFSAYRSDGGHAVAQIINYPGKAVVAALAIPPGIQSMMLPWLAMMRGS